MKYLIACLGNIGAEYDNTRHNIGFKIADRLAKDLEGSFTTNRLAQTAEMKFKGKTLLVIKPTTYMNLSGKAVKYWLDQEKIPIENLLVVNDDIALNRSEDCIHVRDQRCLSASALANNTEHFAFPYIEIDVIQRFYITAIICI